MNGDESDVGARRRSAVASSMRTTAMRSRDPQTATSSRVTTF
jgi:hypothetical protein